MFFITVRLANSLPVGTVQKLKNNANARPKPSAPNSVAANNRGVNTNWRTNFSGDSTRGLTNAVKKARAGWWKTTWRAMRQTRSTNLTANGIA